MPTPTTHTDAAAAHDAAAHAHEALAAARPGTPEFEALFAHARDLTQAAFEATTHGDEPSCDSSTAAYNADDAAAIAADFAGKYDSVTARAWHVEAAKWHRIAQENADERRFEHNERKLAY